MGSIALQFAMEHETRHLVSLDGVKPSEDFGAIPVPIFRSKEHKDLLVAISGIGKVAASMCASALFATGKVDAVVTLGVGGALSPLLGLGDFVVASSVVEHDFDLRPLTDSVGIGVEEFSGEWIADTALSQMLMEVASLQLGRLHDLEAIPMRAAKLHLSQIASGDQLISSLSAKTRIREAFPSALVVDMETVAIAKVAARYNLPWAALRIISDSADESFNASEVLDFTAAFACREIGEISWAFADRLNSR